MDCKTFNENITEYEAGRLSKKHENEFLEHKNSCCDCNEVYDLIFCDEIIAFDEVETIDLCTDNVCSSVMDKIQFIEKKGYNFKLYNTLYIVFGVIVSFLLLWLMTEAGRVFLQVFELSWKSTKNVLNDVNSGFGFATDNLAYAYVHSIIYIVIVFLIIAFIVTIFDNIKLKIKTKKVLEEIKDFKEEQN